MVSANSAAISAIALGAFLQLCPAPIPASLATILGGIGGGIATGSLSGGLAIAASKNKRFRLEKDDLIKLVQRDLPPGVSQESMELCVQQINDQYSSTGVSVYVHSTGETAAQVDNVPPACMNLATVFLDQPAQAGGSLPTPLSSSSLGYTDLTADELQQLRDALAAKAA